MDLSLRIFAAGRKKLICGPDQGVAFWPQHTKPAKACVYFLPKDISE